MSALWGIVVARGAVLVCSWQMPEFRSVPQKHPNGSGGGGGGGEEKERSACRVVGSSIAWQLVYPAVGGVSRARDSR